MKANDIDFADLALRLENLVKEIRRLDTAAIPELNQRLTYLSLCVTLLLFFWGGIDSDILLGSSMALPESVDSTRSKAESLALQRETERKKK